MLVLRALANILFALILLMIFTGGAVLRLERGKLDLAQVSVWGAVLLLITLGLAWRGRNLSNPANLGWAGRSWCWLRDHARPSWAEVLLGATAATLFAAHVLKHWNLTTDGYDVSFVHQALFFPWQDGRWLRADILPSGSALEGHLTFSFFLLAPLTTLFRSDALLFGIQAALLFLPIAVMLRQGPLVQHRGLWLWIALLIVSHRALRNAAVFDFREDAIAYAAFFAMGLALLRGKIPYYLLAFAVAMTSKENIFAITLFFAIPILFSRELPLGPRPRKWLAFLTLVASLIYGVLAFKYWIPAFTAGHAEAHPFFARYGAYGRSVPEIIANVAVSPALWWELTRHVFTLGTLKYLALLFGPFLVVLIAGRSREVLIWLAPAAPGLLMNLAHPYQNQRAMTFHYELILLPFLILATFFAARRLAESGRGPHSAVWFWAILTALAFSDRWPAFQVRQHWPLADHLRIHFALQEWPVPETPVLVSNRLSAQVNHWPKLRISDTPDAACPAEVLTDELLTTGLGEVRPADALWLLDLRKECDRSLAAELTRRGCRDTAPLSESGHPAVALFSLSCETGNP